MNTLVVMEIFYLFFIRNVGGTALTWRIVRGTPIVWLSITIVTIAQFGLTYLPPLQAVFDTAPVGLLDGLLIIGVGVVAFIIIEIEKQVRLRARAMRAS
jgi:magnesium-transporting ATPase (P-type)